MRGEKRKGSFDDTKYYREVMKKIGNKAIYCDYCKKAIKGKQPSISWKLPKRYNNTSNIPGSILTNLQYIKFRHHSCAYRHMQEIVGRK